MAAAETVVLVPDERGERHLSDLEGVRVARYDVGDPSSADVAAHVLVPPQLGRGLREAVLAIVERLPDLALLQTLSHGFEQWEGLLPDGVALSNARGAHGAATAEWVAAALLAVERELAGFVRAQDRGTWTQHQTASVVGRRVLLVGAGNLADELAPRLHALGAATTLVGRTARAGVHATSELPDLVPDHDVVVLLVPLDDDTRGMADAAFLARMPDGAVLVNAARGAVVDTDALLAELHAGRLRAALDVTDPEPLPDGHPLFAAPNLLLTPHVAGATFGNEDRAWAVVRDQVAAFARGDRPPNQAG